MKKLLVSFLLGIVLLLSFASLSRINAAGLPNNPNLNSTAATADTSTGTWYNQSFQEWYNKVYDTSNPNEIFGERYTAAQVQWVIYGLFSSMINSTTGPQTTQAIQCFLTNSANINNCVSALQGVFPKITAAKQGMINQNQNKNATLLSLVFASDRPISGISYIKERIQKLSLVPEVYAQTTNSSVGFGYGVLKPIQQMWVAVRDAAFALFVIVAIVMAFMIMFRVKISPQVVISIQSALPKIIIALILVTFSYAIAGFLIDLMYVVIGFVSLMLAPMANSVALFAKGAFSSTDVFQWMTVGQLGLGIFGTMIIYIILFLVSLLLLLACNLGVVGAGLVIFIPGVSAVLGIILIVAVVIILIIALWNSFKTLFSLIKAFASVLLLTIVAPLEIAAGVVIPNFGFNMWLKSFLAALSTFIVTGILIFMSYIFLWEAWAIAGFSGAGDLMQTISTLIFGSVAIITATNLTGTSGAGWPPLIGGGGNNPAMALLFLGVSFVIFTLIPKASEIVQAFITGKPFAYGTSLGEAVGPVGTFGLGYAGRSLADLQTPWPLNRIRAIRDWREAHPNTGAGIGQVMSNAARGGR